MPIDLLLNAAGEYERTHQAVLQVLFENGLAEHLGLPHTVSVHWEHEGSLLDLALQHEGPEQTGVEIKTWQPLTEGQVDRQRKWAAESAHRHLFYVLMGFSEYEGVPGHAGLREKRVGVAALADGVEKLARSAPGASLGGLADGYGRWLRRHHQRRIESMTDKVWHRLQWAIFYDQVRASQRHEVSIYKVDNASGGIHVLNFLESWKSLGDKRVPDAMFFWEFVDGVPCFKFGPTGDASNDVKRAVRSELQHLTLAAGRERGVTLESTGRVGEHMMVARATTGIRPLWRDGTVAGEQVREVIDACWNIHGDVLKAWRARR